MKSKLIYVGIRVTNLQISIDFYTKVLGMNVKGRGKLDQTKGETVELENEKDGFVLELNYYEKDSPFNTKYVVGEGLDHLAFKVDNLEKARAFTVNSSLSSMNSCVNRECLTATRKTGIRQKTPTKPQPIVITLHFPLFFAPTSKQPGFSSFVSVSRTNSSNFTFMSLTMDPLLWIFVLEWFSTFDTFGSDGRLNGVTFLALYDQLSSAVLAIVSEESGFPAFRTVNR